MKAIKILVWMVMALGFLIPSSLAISSPCPIYGVVSTLPVSSSIGLHVQASINGLPVGSFVTASDGSYVIDIGNQVVSCGGTSVSVSVNECQSNSLCSKSAVLGDAGGRVDFQLGALLPPKCVINSNLVYGQVLDQQDSACAVHVVAPNYVPVACNVNHNLAFGENYSLVNPECNIQVSAPALPPAPTPVQIGFSSALLIVISSLLTWLGVRKKAS